MIGFEQVEWMWCDRYEVAFDNEHWVGGVLLCEGPHVPLYKLANR